MMSREEAQTRTTVSLNKREASLADEHDINVSKATREAIRERVSVPYYIGNSNQQSGSIPDDGLRGVAGNIFATYKGKGGPATELPLNAGLFLYQSEVGIRTWGYVVAECDGTPVSDDEHLYPTEDVEYHVGVDWNPLLHPADAITASEIKRVASRRAYSGTLRKIDYEAGQLLTDIYEARR